MPYLPILVLLALGPAQAAPKGSPEPTAAPKEATADSKAETKPSTTPAPRVDTEAEKYLKAAADKLDKYDFVSAQIRQVVRVGEQQIESTGIYEKGPQFRARFELNVSLGDAVGKRISICDGKVGYRYQKILDSETLETFKMDELVGLLEQKEIPEQARNTLDVLLPMLHPGKMLRSYLDTATFDKMSGGEWGGRRVQVLEGNWTSPVVQQLVGAPVADLTQIGGDLPQYLRIYLDEESGWPIRVALFRRDKSAEYKPLFVLEFLKLSIGKPIPDENFQFVPPPNVVPQDVSNNLLLSLRTLKDKGVSEPGKESAPADGKIDGDEKKPASP